MWINLTELPMAKQSWYSCCLLLQDVGPSCELSTFFSLVDLLFCVGLELILLVFF